MKKTSQIIRDLREDMDLSQSDIAKVLDISQQYYSKYESNQYELPTRHLITLSKFYNVSADYLLGLSEFREPGGGLQKKQHDNDRIGQLLSDILSLNDASRQAVREYVKLMQLKEKYEDC